MHRSPEARSAWKNRPSAAYVSAQVQRVLVKYSRIAAHKSTRALAKSRRRICVDDLASHFHNKIADISRSTANAPPPTISARSAPSLTVFDQVTEQEVAVLIKNTPAKSCPLDPIPT